MAADQQVVVEQAMPIALVPMSRSARVWRGIQRSSYALFASVLLVALAILTEVLDPNRLGSGFVVTLGLAAPLVLAAMAEAPVFLSGGGGCDMSIGPLMGLTNAIVITWLLPISSGPWLVIPGALCVGAASGLLIGFLVTVVRLQPIVVTLGTYLTYSGLTLWILPQPNGTAPGWLTAIANGWNGVPVPVLVIALVLLCWWGITRLPFYGQLMAVGNNDRSAYTAGVNVVVVRTLAYVIGGLIGAVAGLALTGLLASADPTVGPAYTLQAIAAVALGGVSLAGGRGGMFGAVVGAIDIFLIQNVLTVFNASTFALEMAYGLILVIAIVLNTELEGLWKGSPVGRKGAKE
jgi:ribose transport system permease protein